MPARNFLELQHLLSGLCDGQLSDGEFARLEHLLESDPSFRRHYLAYVDLHGTLLVAGRQGNLVSGERMTAPAPSSGCGREIAAPLTVPRQRFSLPRVFSYVAVAAAAVAAVLLLQFLAPPQEPPSVNEVGTDSARLSRLNQPATDPSLATLRKAVDCTWDTPARFQEVGARLVPGEYRLLKGVATIDFDSGSELILEGPAVLRLETSTAVSVQSGKVVFRSDESAAPFSLRTPSSTLVELDTEFAVAVSEAGDEVHVFEGKVTCTSNLAAHDAKPEELKAGEARRFERVQPAPSTPMPCDPKRFVRHVATPAPPHRRRDLLAYEGFDYRSSTGFANGKAEGGFGWAGPWKTVVVRLPSDTNKPPRPVLNIKESLTRRDVSVPSVGGSFEHAGFAKSWRRLAVPVRLDTDGVYYLSYLFRRDNPAPHPMNSAAILFWTDEDYQQKKNEDFWKRLSIGIMKSNFVYTSLQRMKAHKTMPLEDGVTYLLVAKIVASHANPDQVFARVYRADEPVETTEPTNWPLQSHPFRSDLVFDWMQLHVNSKTRQTLDEIRLGTTWSSVTAAWRPAD